MKARTSVAVIVLVAFASILVSCSSSVGVTTKIKAKLASDEGVRDYHIDVTTRDGVVTLTGNINSQDAKERALALARETDGVAQVVDMISVKTSEGTGSAPEPGRSLGEHVDDAGITMRVKGRLLEDPLVKGLQIDVDTRDGVVFLTGSVGSAAEKEKAIGLAKGTEGVRDVRANLTIKSS